MQGVLLLFSFGTTFSSDLSFNKSQKKIKDEGKNNEELKN